MILKTRLIWLVLVLGLFWLFPSKAFSIDVSLSPTFLNMCSVSDEERGWTKYGKILEVAYHPLTCYNTSGQIIGCPGSFWLSEYGNFVESLHRNVNKCLTARYISSLNFTRSEVQGFFIYTFQIWIDQDGTWKFKISNTDDNTMAFIENDQKTLVPIDSFLTFSEKRNSQEFPINLSRGWHKVVIQHYNGIGNIKIKLSYMKPSSSDWYYVGQNLNDLPIRTLQFNGQDITQCIPAFKSTYFVDYGELF